MITKRNVINVQNLSMIDIFLLKNGFECLDLENYHRLYKKTINEEDFDINFRVELHFLKKTDNFYDNIVYVATLKVYTNESENGNVISLLPPNKYVEPELKNTLVIQNIKNNLIVFDLL
jgi:hypothetical protein